jgi:hypothetical protein
MGQEELYDERYGDPKYEADDDRDLERERAERDEWLLMVARQLEAAGR